MLNGKAYGETTPILAQKMEGSENEKNLIVSRFTNLKHPSCPQFMGIYTHPSSNGTY
jgi:hypothetical protein